MAENGGESRGGDDKGEDRVSSLGEGMDSVRPVTQRGRLGSFVQRWLKPGEFEQEQTLLDLIEDLGRCRSESELAGEVGRGLDQVFRPAAVHLFLRRNVRYRLVYSTERPLEPQELAPSKLPLFDRSNPFAEPLRVEGASRLSPKERAWLRTWGVSWIVPLLHPREDVGPVGHILLADPATQISAVHQDLLQTLGQRVALGWVAMVLAEKDRLAAEQGKGRWLKECSVCSRCFDADAFFCPDDDSVLEPSILLDRTIAGRYRLERRLGQGGMGSVYHATDQTNGRGVAIKILAGGDRVAHGRFANEARAGQVIEHENITRVIESGRLGQQGAFMAMEYVGGRTLRQVLDQEMPVDPPRVAAWFDQVLAGVAEAHSQGVIHRDLKPDNVMLVELDGEELIKVLDFGLAKMRDPSSGNQLALTAAGMVIGTLSYMSPEQLAADADEIDHRTDIFALGVMVTEALTGRLPFFAKNLGEMLRAVATQPFRLEVQDLTQAKVADILGRALAKAPADRYSTVADLRRDLVPALRECAPFAAVDPAGQGAARGVAASKGPAPREGESRGAENRDAKNWDAKNTNAAR